MKDGRPSLVNDIRYFFGSRAAYLKGHEEVVAFGRRLAFLLNSEGVSLGTYTALYVQLTTTLEPGDVQITTQGGDWWQRYVDVGVPLSFPSGPDSSQHVIRGTINAIVAIRPELAGLVESSAVLVQEAGDRLRFLIRSRQTKEFRIDISFNIAPWPTQSYLFVNLSKTLTGEIFEAPPIPLQFYTDAFALAASIRVTKSRIPILPQKSFRAALTSSQYGVAIGPSLDSFSRVEKQPLLSKLVKPRGY